MKITFVHLGREHLGIEYLSSLLKQAGHRTALAYDPGLFGPEDNVFHIRFLEKLFNLRQQIISQVLESSPDLIALTVYSGTYAWAGRIAAEIRQIEDTPTVFGGIHATLAPRSIIENDFADFVVEGEGFEALPELAGALENNGSVEDIANLWFKKDGRVNHNPPRPPFSDFDSLPLPDKALFEKDVNFRDDYVILTSLGCVFNCSYCCESYLNRLYRNRYFRRREVEAVMKELVIMKNRYGFKEVMFNDALFFTDKRWLKQLLARYVKEIGVPFRCFGKINNLDEEVCRLLKESGCYCIEFGLQTLNETIRKTVLHRNETNQQARAAFRLCDSYRLRYDIDHMFGLPGETEQDHIEGALFYSRLRRLNRVKCHNLTYFPNLPIIESARRKNILDQADLDDIDKGRITNFFHDAFIKDRQLRRARDTFSRFFKLLPLIPAPLVRWLTARRRYELFRFIPSPLVIAGQLLAAVKGRDYRYVIYFKYYPLRIKRVIKRKWLTSGRTAPGDGPGRRAGR